jgi:uracil-DNA glycosylase
MHEHHYPPMEYLSQTLSTINECHSCCLMTANQKLGIPYITIVPKPQARFIFIGRDPSPSTVTHVGVRDGKSAFIREVFSMIDGSGVCEDDVYITNMCKCHWRTSRGTPLRGTEDRSPIIPKKIANACISQWLFKEIEILKPRLLVSFGEELYQIFKAYIIEPIPAPGQLSASKDKSMTDAELLVNDGVVFKIQLGSEVIGYIPMRHAGNSVSLPRNKPDDRRGQAYKLSKERVIKLLMKSANG